MNLQRLQKGERNLVLCPQRLPGELEFFFKLCLLGVRQAVLCGLVDERHRGGEGEDKGYLSIAGISLYQRDFAVRDIRIPQPPYLCGFCFVHFD